VKIIGYAPTCLQQFFAISAERRLTHPAVTAITSGAKVSLFGKRSRGPDLRRSTVASAKSYRVGLKRLPAQAPSEPCAKVSPHTAQAFQWAPLGRECPG
jgi:hypothetical protein